MVNKYYGSIKYNPVDGSYWAVVELVDRTEAYRRRSYCNASEAHDEAYALAELMNWLDRYGGLKD